jgi:putative redox protein
MIHVEARHLGGVQFEVEARGHRVICDQPLGNGGSDIGMTPPEFLLASLATCAGYYAAEYLKMRGLSCKGLAVRVETEKAAQPARLASFRIGVTTPALDERDQAGVLRAVKRCLIHNTLLGAPQIDVAVHAPHAPILAAA